jgi:hypothetical protein
MNTQASRKEDLAYFQTHNNCRLPFCIEVASNRTGAHVVVVGATHGNEPAGVKAMVAFHQQVKNGDLKLESGNVSLLLGNPQAFEKDQRYVDRDLNRSFKEPDSTAIEGRRACNIIQYLEQNRGIAALLAHYRMLPPSVEAPQRGGLTVDQYESISAIKPGPNFRFLIADVATGTKLTTQVLKQ